MLNNGVYRQTSNIIHIKFQTWMFLVSPCSFLYPSHSNQVVNREWRCSCSSADKRYSNSLQWRLNERGSVSNHQCLHCLLDCRFRRRSKKTSKLRVTGLCAGNSPVTGEFPAQKASNAENVSIWWRHHVHLSDQQVYCLLRFGAK